ncbi:hypothetical protein M378DRAFT_738992 [Amanita muscaria Koide BX008]|uniref:SHSP domain-containing protein n=1 Tax=Amanita muscaria (strain Koide BX008) TaxID=946122 RepID=A0A0C2WMR2_AMAMK|nr:hypothetical protein M378DRAFT_738992 [Amanita muscaria Koide BX008]
MSYPSPFNFPPPGESYNTTPTTPIEGIDFPLPQWETVEREQQQQQRLQHQDQPQHPHAHSHPPTPTTYQTIQPEEQAPPPPRVVPSQIHHESAPAAHAHTHGHEGRSGLIHTLDYSCLSTHVSDFLRPISISPPTASTSSGLVTRQARPRHETAHPYKRPQSALGTKPTTATTTMQGGSRRQSVAIAHASSSVQAVRSMSGSSSRSGATVTQLRSGPPSPDLDTNEELGKRYLIRADVHVDPESKVFTALMELPGVRKDEVRVTLSRCWYNGVKQVTVSGRTRDPFPSSQGGQGLGKVVRERKYGRFIRTFAVSSDTKLEDLDVSMEDGVLALKIQNSQLFLEANQMQDVPIR